MQNFRRREECFKCSAPKSESGEISEISSVPTNRELSPNLLKIISIKRTFNHIVLVLLLSGLDALTRDDVVLAHLRRLTTLPIKSARIGRDPLTQVSRGVCYVQLNSVPDAIHLHNTLMAQPAVIEDRCIAVAYCSDGVAITPGSTAASGAANAALAAAQWSREPPRAVETRVQAATAEAPKSEEEIERLAVYSADLYAKTPEERASYLEYYRNYYRNGGDPNGGQQQQQETKKEENKEDKRVLVNGIYYKKHGELPFSTMQNCVTHHCCVPRRDIKRNWSRAVGT